MQNQTQKTANTANKFQSAEQLWFWFLYTKQTRAGYSGGARPRGRVCELLDVETLITKLYLAGKLSADQLDVMKRFGDKRRAPHQHIWAENRAAALWQGAMETIAGAAMARGWLE